MGGRCRLKGLSVAGRVLAQEALFVHGEGGLTSWGLEYTCRHDERAFFRQLFMASEAVPVLIMATLEAAYSAQAIVTRIGLHNSSLVGMAGVGVMRRVEFKRTA